MNSGNFKPVSRKLSDQYKKVIIYSLAAYFQNYAGTDKSRLTLIVIGIIFEFVFPTN